MFARCWRAIWFWFLARQEVRIHFLLEDDENSEIPIQIWINANQLNIGPEWKWECETLAQTTYKDSNQVVFCWSLHAVGITCRIYSTSVSQTGFLFLLFLSVIQMTESAAFPVDFSHASFIALIIGVQRRSVLMFVKRLVPFLFCIRHRIQRFNSKADEEEMLKIKWPNWKI